MRAVARVAVRVVVVVVVVLVRHGQPPPAGLDELRDARAVDGREACVQINQ